MKHIILMFLLVMYGSNVYAYDGSTTAAVTLAGGVIKAQHTENTKKYKRKDCPVCLGKGYYISGDKITKVDCGYCEPETQSSEVEHPPVILFGPKETTKPPTCNGPKCKRPSILKR